MRDSKLKNLMLDGDRPRAERRRDAMKLYRSLKSPFGTRSKSLGKTRAMVRVGVDKDGKDRQANQGKHSNKRVSLKRYLKGWLFTSSSPRYTHVPKCLRKGKTVAEIQKLREQEFKAQRKRRASFWWL